MRSDRSISAAGGAWMNFEQAPIQSVAHSVQPLKFIAVDAPGGIDDRRDCQCIVSRKLRKDFWSELQKAKCTDFVRQIGHRLAGEDGISVQAALLRVLDLGVPIRAFD